MIVVFDADCVLCSGSVQWLLRHDRNRIFRFTSIRSERGAALLAGAGLEADRLETMLLIDRERFLV